MTTVDDILAEHFACYRTDDPDPVWEAIEAKYQPGDAITGEIVARFSFGLAIDFGAEFPGILLGTRIPNMTAEILETLSGYQIGRRITAKIERFVKKARQVGLTQLDDATSQPKICGAEQGMGGNGDSAGG